MDFGPSGRPRSENRLLSLLSTLGYPPLSGGMPIDWWSALAWNDEGLEQEAVSHHHHLNH